MRGLVPWVLSLPGFCFLVAGAAGAAPAVNGRLVYGSGQPYETVIFEPKLIATLNARGRKPFLVFSGLGCEECDIDRSVYIPSPMDPPRESGELAPSYSHPGKYYDGMSRALVETVRMFVGRCITPKAEGVVWFLNTQMRSGGWERRTFVASIEGEALVEGFNSDPKASLAAVQAAVARRSCREVAGERFYTEP